MSTSKPIKRPVPKPAAAVVEAVAETVSKVKTTVAAAPASTTGDGIADLNVKMDKLLELAQAIDWKIWIYLKANNYID
jgi:hypothetical protein